MSDIQFPEAFEQRMRNTLNDEWNAFAEAHKAPLPVSIRLNPLKATVYPDAEKIPWANDGRYLPSRPVFTLDPLFHAGCYYVQESSSMFLEQAVKQSADLSQPIRALDLCAAPGGKSTHLLSLLHPQSLLVSNEVIRSRASILDENIQKWGHDNRVVTNNDPEHFEQLAGFFDLIVVDAPCSGEGLFRRDQEAMNEWSPDNVALCASRQKRILAHAWPALKENGILIYCTCTFNELENEDNLLWLVREHDVEFVELKTEESWGIQRVQKGSAFGYRFYPHKTTGEGFFISVIRKRSSEKEARAKNTKRIFSAPSKTVHANALTWIKEDADRSILQFRDTLLLLPAIQMKPVEFLSDHLHIVQAGTPLGVLKHEKIIPEHAAALSVALKKDTFQCIDVSHEDALHYLRKETLSIDGLKRGFSLICYNGTPIGWVNVLDNRLNNLYPANWRVRMQGNG